jgi:hypothetical protein
MYCTATPLFTHALCVSACLTLPLESSPILRDVQFLMVFPSRMQERTVRYSFGGDECVFFSNHTAFKLNSLWHVGYHLDNFYGFHVCSRVKPQLFNLARRPALIQGATAFGLYALLLVLACGRNCWSSSPVLSIIPLSCSCYRLDASIGGGVLCIVHTISFWGLPAKLGTSPRDWVP